MNEPIKSPTYLFKWYMYVNAIPFQCVDSLVETFKSFVSGAFECLAMVRMSDGNQRFRTLLIVLAEEIHHTVFGHDVMHVRSRGCHTRSFFELDRHLSYAR